MTKKKTETTTLHLPNFYGWAGIICIVVAVAMPLYVYTYEGIDGFIASFSVVAIFLLLGSSLVLARWIMKIQLDEDRIIKTSFIGLKKKLLIDDIKSVKFNKWTLELKLNDGKRTIRCHQHLLGFEKILNVVNQRGFEIRDL